MLQIDSGALKALQTLKAELSKPVQGLRMIPSGDNCQGYQLQLGWSDKLFTDDLQFELAGITLIADRSHWSLLQGGTIELTEKEGIPGLSVKLQPAGCQCESGRCDPSSTGQKD